MKTSRTTFIAEALCLLGLVGVWLALTLPRLNGPIDFRWDASTYYVLGTALAEGMGYRLLNEPSEISAVQYPPALSFIVALHQWYLGTADIIIVGSKLRLTYLVLSGIYLFVIYLFVRKWLSRVDGVLVTAIITTSFYGFLYLSDTLYAELPFAITTIFFFLCQRRQDSNKFRIIQGLSAYLAYLFRTAGLAVIVAWVLHSILQHNYRQATIRALAGTVPILIWYGWILKTTESVEYVMPAYSYQRAAYNYANVPYSVNSALIDPFTPQLGVVSLNDILLRIAANITHIPRALGESAWLERSFSYDISKILRLPLEFRGGLYCIMYICIVLVGLLALYGALLFVRNRESLVPLYFATAVGLIALAPWPSQFPRYCAPLAPITLLMFSVGLRQCLQILLGRLLSPKQVSWTLSLVLCGMLVVNGLVASVTLRNGLLPITYFDREGQARSFTLMYYAARWHNLDMAFEWLRINGDSGAIIATAVPHLAYLRSGHKAVLPPFEQDSRQAMRLLAEVPVTYLVVDELEAPVISESFIAPLVASFPEAWKRAFSVGGTHIYKLKQGS